MAIFYSLTFNLLASQLFGIKPCQVYPSLDIKQFVQKFKPILKVAEEDLPSYKRHVDYIGILYSFYLTCSE